MGDLHPLPPPPGSPRGSMPCAPGQRPTFLRSTIQKLQSDTARSLPDSGGSKEATLGPITPTSETPFKIGHSPLGGHAHTSGDPWQHDRCFIGDRCYLKGIFMHDLERYRAAFAEELRTQLRAVQEALQGANVGRFFDELALVREREVQGQQELLHLRSHCEQLLRLNAQLRQQQLDAQMAGNGVLAQEIRDEIASQCRQGGLGGAEQSGVESEQFKTWLQAELQGAVERELQPLKVGQQNMQSKLKRVESFNTGLVDELRKLMLEELKPLKAGQAALQAKLKRSEALEETFAQRREEVDAKVTQLELQQQIQAIKSEAFETDGGGGGGGGGAASADVAQVLARLEDVTKETKDLVSTNHSKIFLNHGKVLTNHTIMCDNLAELKESLESMQKAFDGVNATIERVPDVVLQHLHATETAEEAELRRLRQQMLAKDKQLEKLKGDLAKEKGGCLQFLFRIRDLERRGNLVINLKNGDVDMKDIKFVSRKPSQEPEAEFVDESAAVEILADLAELWDMFKVPLCIEGHTKGGESDFWQNLATNRAKLVASKLAEMGVLEEQLNPEGFPGKLGKNQVVVDVNLDIFPDCD